MAGRSQFSPLPGAGVSCPAVSRQSPVGVVTDVPAVSFHPDELLVDGHDAAHSADMYPGFASHWPSFAHVAHFGFLSTQGQPSPHPTTTDGMVSCCHPLSSDPLGPLRSPSQLCETYMARLFEIVGQARSSRVVLVRSKPSTSGAETIDHCGQRSNC